MNIKKMGLIAPTWTIQCDTTEIFTIMGSLERAIENIESNPIGHIAGTSRLRRMYRELNEATK